MPKTPEKKLEVCRMYQEKVRSDPKKHAAQKEYQRKYRVRNKDRIKGLQLEWRKDPVNKMSERVRRLGLSEYLIPLIMKHSGLCDICGDPPHWKTLHIDHDHATGFFRGMLCMHCNQGVGKFKDDPSLLTKAIKYLGKQTS
jgi:hypothetical protein